MTRDAHDQLQRLRVKMGFITRDLAQLEPIDGRYEVVEEVAMGGMGKVYLVRDLRFESGKALVALKLVASPDPALRDRLWREAHALLSLRKSKHVVPVYDIGRRDDDIYFTMRHVAGGTLRDWQVGKSLPELLDAYLLAAQGLVDAHGCGIVHRDFKPENVLIEGPDVLVADFGLAAAIASPTFADVAGEPARPALAPANVTLGGTLPYMAPEQFAGEPADAKTDQFAFCVALWEACAGCLPWTWKRREEQLEAMRRPAQAQRPIPAWLRSVLLRGMAFERSARFPDVATLVRQIEQGRGRRSRAFTLGMLGLGLVGAAAFGMCVAYEPPESCESFAATIDEHWPREVELDVVGRKRIDELASVWRARASSLCVDEVAPPSTDAERRCMESWLVSLDAVLDAPPPANMAIEVIENLAPGESYCEMQRIGLDDHVQRELERARVASMSGDHSEAMAALARAEQRADELADAEAEGLARAEVELVRIELLTRAGHDDEARAALAGADAATQRFQEPRAELMLAWARYLALAGSNADLHDAELHYREGKGLIGVAPSGLREAALLETRGQIDRALGRYVAAAEVFEQAASSYDRLGRPLHAIRARQNAGAVAQESGDYPQAERIYRGVLSTLPPGGESSLAALNTRFELAEVLKLQQYERDEHSCTEALAQLEIIAASERGDRAAETHGRALQIIGELGCAAELEPWASRAEVALVSVEDAGLHAQIEVQLALALLFVADPRGERRVLELLVRRELRETPYFALLLGEWLKWLAEQGRCEELHTWLREAATSPDSIDCTPANPRTRP